MRAIVIILMFRVEKGLPAWADRSRRKSSKAILMVMAERSSPGIA
jgi:hypothetical protein